MTSHRDPLSQPPAPARGTCPSGKVCLAHAEAKGAARRIRRRDRARNTREGAVREYLCNECEWWHVGHPNKGRGGGLHRKIRNPDRYGAPPPVTPDGIDRLFGGDS